MRPPVVGEYGVPISNDFFEEPVLLLAFILLGRALESPARARARGVRPARALHALPLDAKLVVADKAEAVDENDEDPMTVVVDARLRARGPGARVARRSHPGGRRARVRAAVDAATLARASPCSSPRRWVTT